MNLDSLRKHFQGQGKPFLTRILLLFSLGVVLLLASTFLGRPEAQRQTESELTIISVGEPTSDESDYEKILERRLAEILSLVQGAGRVEVMLTLSNSREIILAEDLVSNESLIRETDSAGGNRESHSLSKDMRTILVGPPGGSQEPIILREILPRVEGVIIVAEGGDDAFVREALIRATRTVLGVDIHRVQVLQRKLAD